MSEKNTMTRNAMLFLPAKLAEGVLLMAMSSLYSHILTKSAVGLFNATNMMVNFTFLLIAAWMSNSNTRYVAEEFKKGPGGPPVLDHRPHLCAAVRGRPVRSAPGCLAIYTARPITSCSARSCSAPTRRLRS